MFPIYCSGCLLACWFNGSTIEITGPHTKLTKFNLHHSCTISFSTNLFATSAAFNRRYFTSTHSASNFLRQSPVLVRTLFFSQLFVINHGCFASILSFDHLFLGYAHTFSYHLPFIWSYRFGHHKKMRMLRGAFCFHL